MSVARPGRKNCGTCHFYGGGGDGVKHGDLDSSLVKPNKELDVHMGTDGQNFDCTRCHSTSLHNIAGRVYSTPASKHRKSLVEDDLTSKITCESCHTDEPHKDNAKANDHTDKVACQSCHIPAFARVNPTKMWWDWSTGGKKKNGKPYVEKDAMGKPIYMSKKGSMRWEKNVEPEYFWYNGAIKHLTVKDTIDPSKIVEISKPEGNRGDKDSRIFPFKVHTGKQPYDKVNKTILLLNLFADNKKDIGAYWKTFDWKASASSAMTKAGLPFSGELDFVETSYVFPTTHMVAPREKALACVECHTNNDGRLAKLGGFYMPGRDYSQWVNTVGWVILTLTFIGIIFHILGRLFIRSEKREG